MKRKQEIVLILSSLFFVLCCGCHNEAPKPDAPLVESPGVTQTSTPTPMPTKPPVEITAPFAIVSPVPQSEVTDIAGTMTAEEYPVVDGSTATLPLSEAVFMLATGESAEVAADAVVHTKTTNSYNRLYAGEVDLLIVYEPAESIVERMKTEPLCIKPIGLDALVFLANTANPLESLTMEQLVDIYSGKISNWEEVGGMDKELLAFQRPSGSGSQTLMQKLVMKDTEMVSGDNVFRYSTMSDILEGMLSYNNEDNTLGYSVFYYANNMYVEKDLKLLGVDGVIPSTQTIYDGSYQLTNAFYAVVRTDEPKESNARKIFDWLTGEAGQQLVLELGYVPVQMPEGADISTAGTESEQKVEILATEPLSPGQYFVFANPQNMVSDYYYGDMTVYDHNWEEVASFYNVTLNHGVQGIYQNRYLPIGQIRQNTSGEQKVYYGVYDLEQGVYSVKPSYEAMEMLDVERGYYAVPPADMEKGGAWSDWAVINGTGEVLLEQIEMSDWLMITKFGNGYLEMLYDYSNWENGCVYRYYDETLRLRHVYCQQVSTLPEESARKEGVEYTVMDAEGCVVDADGNVVLSRSIFLEQFGDGEDTDCRTAFYSVAQADETVCYPVLYKNKVYLLDANGNLIRIVENPKMAEAFQNADFGEDVCYYLDWSQNTWVYETYDGEPLVMCDGSTPEEITNSWRNNSYVMYRKEGENLYIEEHTAQGACQSFSVKLREDMQKLYVSYTASGYIVVSQDCGETTQSPYQEESNFIPVFEKSLYYQGTLVYHTRGLEYDYMHENGENGVLWVVPNGNKMVFENESIFEEYENSYPLSECVRLKEHRVLYKVDNAYLIFHGNHTGFFLTGNDILAVGNDGQKYVRALHNLMGTD